MKKMYNWKTFIKFMSLSAMLYSLIATSAAMGYEQCQIDIAKKKDK